MRTTKFTLLLCFCIGMIGATAQQTITLSAEKDNTLYEDPTGSLSNGIGNQMTIGRTSTGEICRGLMAFDIAGNLPTGAVITKAEIQVEVGSASPGARMISLHKLSQNWGEGTSDANANPLSGAQATSNDATWMDTFNGSGTWNSPGGDYHSESSTSQSINTNGRYAFPSSDALVADVQGWLDDPSTNYGWAIVGDETVSSTTKLISTREATVSRNRPSLSITYSMITEITPIADNTMYAESGTLSNGGGDFLFTGNSPNNMQRRSLLKFDLSAIPENANIRSAEMCLHVSRGARVESEVAIHKVLAPWGESNTSAGGDEEGGAPSSNGDATWRFNMFNTNMVMATEWTNLGGDFITDPSASIPVDGPSNYTWTGQSVIDDIQSWITNPEDNHGWILIADESQANTSVRFISKDLDGSSAIPKLKVTYDQTTLPVVMENFEARPKSCEVEISWITHLELNNTGFYIERSSDLKNWDMIHEIQGQMNSADIIQYKYMDQNPKEGLNYYKVKQLDTDGSVKYTQILSVTPSFIRCKESTVSFFPNPSQDFFHYNMSNHDTMMMKRQMSISNSLGQNVLTLVLENEENKIDISTLTSGVYFVSVEGMDSFTIVKE